METRDWLNTIEPRNVRSVMKRLVEEVTSIDKQVGVLFEEGFRKNDGSGMQCGGYCCSLIRIYRNEPNFHVQRH